jgi:hypothetical protein
MKIVARRAHPFGRADTASMAMELIVAAAILSFGIGGSLR